MCTHIPVSLGRWVKGRAFLRQPQEGLCFTRDKAELAVTVTVSGTSTECGLAANPTGRITSADAEPQDFTALAYTDIAVQANTG